MVLCRLECPQREWLESICQPLISQIFAAITSVGLIIQSNTSGRSGIVGCVVALMRRLYAVFLMDFCGYNHVCTTATGGINPVHNRSEFAGLSLVEQREKISKGYKTLIAIGLFPKYFFAPSHTYDENTLEALVEESPIRIISDTIALQPYKQGVFTMIPCQMGQFRRPPIGGYWTFCFHPNGMDNAAFDIFECFIKTNIEYFISFNDIDTSRIGQKSIIDRLLSFVYFTLRKIKG